MYTWRQENLVWLESKDIIVIGLNVPSELCE